MKETCNKSLKLRIFPSKEQEKLIIKTFGCCRFVYNSYLKERIDFYKNIISKIPKEDKDLRLKVYKSFRYSNLKEKYKFLDEVSSQALCQSRVNLEKAFLNFLRSANGTYKGKYNFPKFKSKKNSSLSYRECMPSKTALCWFQRLVKIPKLGKVKFSHDSLPKWYSSKAKLCNITVEKKSSGKYYAVLLFEIEKLEYKVSGRKPVIGLDFSLANLYVNSEGETGKDFGFIAVKQANSKKLAKFQRALARKKLNSKNREKAKTKLARFEETIAFRRKEFIEKETLRLVKSYDKIVIENLNLISMAKFLSNAKNLVDTSWATFVAKLEQKGKDYNCEIIKADRFFQSSQLCSKCGFQNKTLKLSQRVWTCPSCKSKLDRDLNAALNLKNYILSERQEFKPAKDCKQSYVGSQRELKSVETGNCAGNC